VEITGQDRQFLQALSDPKFAISGLTNKDLRQILRLTASGQTLTTALNAIRAASTLQLVTLAA
jgi:hypothetical protein